VRERERKATKHNSCCGRGVGRPDVGSEIRATCGGGDHRHSRRMSLARMHAEVGEDQSITLATQGYLPHKKKPPP